MGVALYRCIGDDTYDTADTTKIRRTSVWFYFSSKDRVTLDFCAYSAPYGILMEFISRKDIAVDAAAVLKSFLAESGVGTATEFSLFSGHTGVTRTRRL